MVQQTNDQLIAQKLLQSQLVSHNDLNKALAVQAQLQSQGHNFSLVKVLIQSRIASPETLHGAGINVQADFPSAIKRSTPTSGQASLFDRPGIPSVISPDAPTIPNLALPDLAATAADSMPTMQLSKSQWPGESNNLPILRFGRYVVTEKLGRGGMGLVYKARHEVLERTAALKTLALNAGIDDPAVALLRFEREAKTMAKLQHPNIVPIYDIGGEGHQAYIAMEYVSGGSLAERIAKDGKIPPRETCVYALKTARALDHAHKVNIIHRDLKPANILISSEGEPMIADFGLALITNQDGSRLSHTGAVIGTLHYMPPEQLDSKSGGIDHRADIYSLGATLFEMLAGHPPFSARTKEQLMYEILFGDPAKFPGHCSDVPEGLRNIIFKCLQRKVEDRYQNTAALCQDLAAYLSGKSIAAPVSPPKKKSPVPRIPTPTATAPGVPLYKSLSTTKLVMLAIFTLFFTFISTCVPLMKILESNDPPKTDEEKSETPKDLQYPVKNGKKDKKTD
jgi:serine/threonine protein kinase